MKPKANYILEQAKARAIQQMTFALNKIHENGNFKPFSWYDSRGQKHSTMAWGWHLEAFSIYNGGTPCYYDYESHKWESVDNLPINRLADYADSILYCVRNKCLRKS